MNQPLFVHLDPQASDINLPDVAWLPAHAGEEIDALKMVQEHSLKLWLITPCYSTGIAHAPPVEAPPFDGFSISRSSGMSESARPNGSSEIKDGPFPLLELGEVVGCHWSQVYGVRQPSPCLPEDSATIRSGGDPLVHPTSTRSVQPHHQWE